MSNTLEITSDIAKITVNTVITNKLQFDAVNMELARFKDKLKAVTADEKSITAPINQSLKEIRGKYKPVKDQLDRAIATMRDAMNVYKRAEDAKRELDRIALEELSKDGQVSLDEMIALVDEAPMLGGRLTTIVDANFGELSAEYKSDLLARVWDAAMVVIRKDVAAGRVETGVSVRKEKVL